MSTNPKLYWQQQALDTSTSASFSTVQNPIAEEIANAENEARYFHSVPVVPFMGQGGVTLDLLTRLCKLSPTQGSIIEYKKHFVLGGHFDVNVRKVPGFARREEQAIAVSDQEFTEYTDWVQEWCDPTQLLGVADGLLENLLKYGNAWMEVVLTSVGGERMAKMYSHDMHRCLYMPTPDGVPRVVLISPYWYHHTSYGEEPLAVPVYPQTAEYADGTVRTMVHIKRRVAGRPWYGEPVHLASLWYGYTELQMGEYNVDGYASDFTGTVFFETYEGFGGGGADGELPLQPETIEGGQYVLGPKGFYTKMADAFSNKGKKQRIVHRNAPLGTTPTTVKEFKPNTNEKFHQITSQISEGQVIKANLWHPALMGIQVAGRLGPSQDFAQAFKSRFFTVIKPLQDTIADALNIGMDLVADWRGQQGATEGHSLGFKNMYADMLKETGGGLAGTQDDAGGLDGGAPIQGEEVDDE